ncbi:TadE/TadG family type IV pilus assembly protein [Streptomyces xanthochromogenes]|uniref:TadE/TadG family type IV pilus assembly protein n=1 Tax=Streptomyces xanthochromogenes TaxID=67384 RepID=UPI002F42E67F
MRAVRLVRGVRSRGVRGRRIGAGGRDRGQTVIEFIGVVPLILLLLVALWQCALVGYAFVLAGNAADEGARAGAAAENGGRGVPGGGPARGALVPAGRSSCLRSGRDRHVRGEGHSEDPHPGPGCPQRFLHRGHRRPREGALSRAHPYAPRARPRRPGPSRPGIRRVRDHPAVRRPRRDPAGGGRVRREPGGHGGAGRGAGGEPGRAAGGRAGAGPRGRGHGRGQWLAQAAGGARRGWRRRRGVHRHHRDPQRHPRPGRRLLRHRHPHVDHAEAPAAELMRTSRPEKTGDRT